MVAWTRKDLLKSAAAVGAALATGIQFLKPAQAAPNRPLRPPGALPEKDFLSTCIRCGRCGDACPNQCITAFSDQEGRLFSVSAGRGGEGTPVIFPRRQACNLCQRAPGEELLCTSACPTGALQPVKKSAEAIQASVSMGVAEVDTHLCYSFTGSSCGVCVKACPFEGKALKAGYLEQPQVNPEACVGCGLCERACIRYPQAISIRARAMA